MYSTPGEIVGLAGNPSSTQGHGGITAPFVPMTVRSINVIPGQRLILLVPYRGAGFAVIENFIVDAGEGFCVAPACRPFPDNFVPEVLPIENSVHDGFEIMRCGGVAMQVDAARRLQEPVHFQQAHGHKAHECAHAVGMGAAGALDGLHEPGIVVGDPVHPVRVHILLPRPPVLKAGPGGEAVRRGVEVAALVERRVRGDEVHGLRIHGPEETQIVPVEQCPVPPVGAAGPPAVRPLAHPRLCHACPRDRQVAG